MAADDRYCLGCNYGLKGLPENRCPECGREFDPENPATFSHANSMGDVARFFSKPIGWPTNAAAIAILALGLVASLYPGGVFSIIAASFVAWLVIGTVFFIRVLGFACVTVFHRIRKGRSDNHPKWLIVPGCFLLWLGLMITEVPAKVFFLANKSALNRFARQVTTLPPGTTMPDQWIGAYPAKSIETFHSGFEFMIKGAGFLDDYGFAYSAQGPPQAVSDDCYDPLGDNWYLWRRDF